MRPNQRLSHPSVARRRPSAALAVLTIANLMAFLAVASPAQAANDCTASAQRRGDCIGWIGAAGTAPVENAIASELAKGRLDNAKRFAETNKASISAESMTRINAAIEAEQREPGAGYEALSPIPDSPVTAFAPPQETNGNPAATTPYYWVLSGGYDYLVSFGYCSGSSCPTLGTLRIDMDANTTFFPAVTYYHRFDLYSGRNPYLGGMEVTMWQDITNASDTKKATYSCSSGSTPLSCTSTRNTPTGALQYHYLRIKWTNQVSGYPTSAAQYTTRRWIVSASQAYYPAYYSGG